MQSLYAPFVLFLYQQPLLADEYDFLAEPEVEEVEQVDPKELWPNKIILDSPNQKLMLNVHSNTACRVKRRDRKHSYI